MQTQGSGVGLGLMVGMLTVGCVVAHTEHRGVPLVWSTDQESPVAVTSNLAPHRFKVRRFVDKRPDPSVIGVNVKRPDRPLQVTTGDDVAAWATDRFVHVLKRQGLEVVEAGETVTLEVEILKLVVIEEGLFNGDVEFRVVAKDTRGVTFWRGGLAGRSKRWGKTNNLENYYEAITNAFESAAKGLVANPAFLVALPR